MIFSRILVSLILALFVVGCSTESRKKVDTIPGSSSDYETCRHTNFLVDDFRTTFSSIASFNSYGIPSKKTYNFRACLVERLGATKIMPDIRFSIEGSGHSRSEATTDRKGCINWSENFEYNHIQPEVIVKLNRKITAHSVYKGCVMAVAAFNPWVNGIFATTDTRNTSIEAYELENESLTLGRIRAANRAISPVEIAVDSLNFEFKGLDFDQYEISKFLNLTVAHKYTLRIKPSVIRRTLENISVPQVLVGGRLKAYLAIFKDEPGLQMNHDTLITTQEFDLEYSRGTGQFMADVSIKFQNVAEMTSRTKAVLTLVPSDELEGIQEMNYIGVLKPAPLATLTLSQGDVSAKKFFDTQKAPSLVRPFDELKSRTSGLVAMNVDLPASYFPHIWERTYNFRDISETALYGKLSDVQKKYLASILCHKLYSSPANRSYAFNCQSNPGFYMSFEVRHLVDEVTSIPQALGDTTVEELDMKVSYSAAQKNSYSKGWKASVGAGLSATLSYDPLSLPLDWSPLKGSLGIKGSGGVDYSWVWEGRYSQDQSVSITSTTSTKITSEGNTFRFNAKSRPCLIAVQSAKIASYLEKKNQQAPGIFLCGDKLLEQTRTETWYMLTQNLGVKDSPFSDSLSKRSGPWRMMIRGRTPMLLFYNFLKESKANLVLERLPSDALKTEFDSALMQMQEFPGLLPKN